MEECSRDAPQEMKDRIIIRIEEGRRSVHVGLTAKEIHLQLLPTTTDTNHNLLGLYTPRQRLRGSPIDDHQPTCQYLPPKRIRDRVLRFNLLPRPGSLLQRRINPLDQEPTRRDTSSIDDISNLPVERILRTADGNIKLLLIEPIGSCSSGTGCGAGGHTVRVISEARRGTDDIAPVRTGFQNPARVRARTSVICCRGGRSGWGSARHGVERVERDLLGM